MTTPSAMLSDRSRSSCTAPSSGADESVAGTDQAMETSPSANPTASLDLGGVYRQCSTARAVGSNMSVTTIGGSGTSTSTCNTPRIGTLDWAGDPTSLKTFHGGRIAKNGRTVNECISASYDPRNMICLGCDKPHGVLEGDMPTTLVFADQNFVPFLSGGEGNCIGIVRGENFSLNELVDLAAEIIDKKTLPPGTVLLFGSGYHLFKVGGACYTTDWINLVNRASQKWLMSMCVRLSPCVELIVPVTWLVILRF
jgi:hypothetical protein